ncbi:MAG TPA: PAS domain S-box protein [Bradyrhizobium sp.]|nr:PAS domain S-box protein [Bradyrhizobium sp.]
MNPDVPDEIAKALLGSESDSIIATDREGRISFWNPGSERIFGFSAAEAVGQSLDLIIPENLRARHWSGYRRVMQTGSSVYGRGDVLSVPALTKDGRRISVEFTIVMLRNGQGELSGMVAVLRDVSQRFAEVRELKRRLAAIAEAK